MARPKKRKQNSIKINGKIFYQHPIHNHLWATECGQVWTALKRNGRARVYEDQGRPYRKYSLSIASAGYLVFPSKRGHTCTVHRILWECIYGLIPEGIEIDHRNGIKTDNRIKNLRLSDRSQNFFNTGPRKHNKLGLKWVSERKGRYLYSVCAYGKHYRGTADTAEEAYRQAVKIAKKVHGKYMRAA